MSVRSSCPKCGSTKITFGARRANTAPGRVFLCRGCLHYVAYDTPERGKNASDTMYVRDRAALARWRKATAEDMKDYRHDY